MDQFYFPPIIFLNGYSFELFLGENIQPTDKGILYTMNAGDPLSEQSTTMTKIIIIESLDNNFSQSFEVSIPYDSHHRELDLGQSLHHILNHKLNFIDEHQIFYFDPLHQLFQYAGIFPFKYPLLIGQDFIAQTQITVRIRRVNSNNEHEIVSQKVSKETQEKRKRVKERTIREVLEKVSEWRELAHKNPKVNLEEGAKIVGIPKKTLDDYYAHIKLGSEYKFDFQHNLDQKIGVLRSFVRENNNKKKQSAEFSFLDNVLPKMEYLSDDDEGEQEEQQE